MLASAQRIGEDEIGTPHSLQITPVSMLSQHLSKIGGGRGNYRRARVAMA